MRKKVVFLPYDMDTAIGINNEGELTFSYNLEDIDHVAGTSDVYNGQSSVLWVNLREMFADELAKMYQEIRTDKNGISYETIEAMFETHQAKWPEAIFNEDSYFTYLRPLIGMMEQNSGTAITDQDLLNDMESIRNWLKQDKNNSTAGYMSMLQGSKAEQRKWWLYNRFRYIDSKYNAGDALTDVVTLRGYARANIEITPYADIYASVKYGSYILQQRASRNQSYVFECPMARVNDTEIYIYSASQIASLGDLSGLQVGYCDFANATRIQELKIGDADSSFRNEMLLNLYLGNNVLLRTLDARNCVNLGGTRNGVTTKTSVINLSGCVGIENVYLDNTSVSGVSLPNGAPLVNLHLPHTITALTLRNLTKLKDLTVKNATTGETDYSNVQQLWVEGCSDAVDPIEILEDMPNNSQVRIIGFDTDAQTYQDIRDFYDKLGKMKGITETGAEIPLSEDGLSGGARESVSGTIHVPELTGAQNYELSSEFPHITIDPAQVTATITFKTWDKKDFPEGSSTVRTFINGILESGTTIPTPPARPADKQYKYSVIGNGTTDSWSLRENQFTGDATIFNNVKMDLTVYAAYSTTIQTYTVTWKNENGTVLETDYDVPYHSDPTYNGSKPTKSVNGKVIEATGWTPSLSKVEGDITYTATYKPIYTATFVNTNGSQLYTNSFIEDETPVYAGATNPPQHPDHESGADDFEFLGWSPALGPIKANTTYTAVYQDKRSKTVQYLTGALTKYETASTGAIREYAFYNMTSLEKVDLTSTSAVTIRANAFYGCTSLDSLIVRSTTMSTLSATSALTSTKIASYEGIVYVNSSALSSYTGNSNWKNYLISTTDDYPASSTKLFELYDAKFSTTTDSWETIATNENYATDYTVGTTMKVVDGGTFGPIIMQLVAMGQDVKADGSGDKARMTWISRDLIATHVMNATNTTARTGKYGDGEGGWAGSEMREWLIDDVLPQINFHASSDAFAPVSVTKTQSIYANNAIQIDGQTTTDSIWIPSDHEIFGTTSYESNEVATYTGWFNSNSRRKKNYNNSASYWWLRSAYSTYIFRCVNGGGSTGGNGAGGAGGVALGFCL